jgi:hypothetical protein
VENRQQKGWDTNLPGNGIIVFHIDYDPVLWVSVYEYVNTSSSQHYLIFPANNKFSTTKTNLSNSKNWAYPYLDNNSLTDTSEPAAQLWHARTDSIFLMSKPLTNMSVDSVGLASFDFMKETSAIQTIKSTSVANERWFDLQGCQLPGRPQRKGLYIVEGRKVVVK